MGFESFRIFRAYIEIGNTPPGDSKGDLIRGSTAGEMMIYLTLAVFYFAINDHAFFGLQDRQATYNTVVWSNVEIQIVARYAGLPEVGNQLGYQIGPISEIHYFHGHESHDCRQILGEDKYIE
jgi:hypothetical protein